MARRKSKTQARRDGVEVRRTYRENQKVLAVQLRDQGFSYDAIAQALYRSDTTVRRWLLEDAP